MAKKEHFERLPKAVVPKVYNLRLKPNLKSFTFEGNVSIEVKIVESVESITLNSLNLLITDVLYKSNDGEEKKPKNVAICTEKETVTITFGSSLAIGCGCLSMNFAGILNDQLNGFYRSKNKNYDESCENQYAAVTHFEATYARKAFPCWDEPSLKAVFNITLVINKDEVALSNMNVINDSPDVTDSNLHSVKFAPSPIMSTYLVAFAVGKYDFVEHISEKGLIMRVYTPVGKKEHGRFALEVLTKVISFYENYFKIDYPLPKLDLLTILDFPIGAMENWGLVTYREKWLLVDPEASSASSKQRIALLVSHEIAHQWFGNLVTMEWWTDLWLKEGFASFMEFFCVSHILPEYDIWTHFLTDTFSVALQSDALDNSHPIEVEVGHPSEVNEIFDAISYDKGASIIRMLHNFIRDQHFQEGLHHYLTKYSSKNTATVDLWNSFHQSSGKPIEEIMSTWTKQKGFPILSVSIESSDNGQKLIIAQKKFCSNCNNKDGTKWMVPISIISQGNSKQVFKQFILSTEQIVIEFNDIPSSHWVKLNPGSIDYYRVQYSSEMLQRFIPSIKDLSLPSSDRLSLLSDHFALVLNGSVSTVELLKLIEAFTDETSYSVWSSIKICLKHFIILLDQSQALTHFFNFGRKLFKKIFAKLGWEATPNESHSAILLRSIVLQCLVIFEDDLVLKEAQRRFEAESEGSVKLPVDLCGIVYQAVASTGNEETLNKLIEMYKAADSEQKKSTIFSSFGAFKSTLCLQKIFKFYLSDEVSAQDFVIFVGSISSEDGRLMAWNFFKKNIETFHKRYHAGMLLTRLTSNLTTNFKSNEMFKEIQKFFEEVPFPGTERVVKQSLENISMNKNWLDQELTETVNWLSENYQ